MIPKTYLIKIAKKWFVPMSDVTSVSSKCYLPFKIIIEFKFNNNNLKLIYMLYKDTRKTLSPCCSITLWQVFGLHEVHIWLVVLH